MAVVRLERDPTHPGAMNDLFLARTMAYRSPYRCSACLGTEALRLAERSIFDFWVRLGLPTVSDACSKGSTVRANRLLGRAIGDRKCGERASERRARQSLEVT